MSLNLEFFVVSFLGSSFLGMINSFSLLSEIYEPIYEGWRHIGTIALALFMIFIWWGGFLWIVIKFL